MTFNLCPLRKFIFWSLQSGLAARQVTAEPCHLGPCQLWISSAPAVLAFRSWLKSFKQAIWHKFQLLVSSCDRATSPKGVIYIPWLLGSLQKRSERKTTCQEDRSEFLLCSLVLCESEQNVYLSKPWFPGDGGSSCPKDCHKNEMK